MSVISIRKRQFLGDYIAQRADIVPEGIGFITRAALSIYGPTILYCVVISQLMPLYLMTGVVTLGSMIGLAMFRRSAEGFRLRIPATVIMRVPSGTRTGELKKAA
jgi:hypothetical protein